MKNAVIAILVLTGVNGAAQSGTNQAGVSAPLTQVRNPRFPLNQLTRRKKLLSVS